MRDFFSEELWRFIDVVVVSISRFAKPCGSQLSKNQCVLFQIPVYKGAVSALVPPEKESLSNFTSDIEFFHGRNGFGDVELPKIDSLPQLQEENAINAMYRLVKQHPGQSEANTSSTTRAISVISGLS